jgi:hypothetical protein
VARCSVARYAATVFTVALHSRSGAQPEFVKGLSGHTEKALRQSETTSSLAEAQKRMSPPHDNSIRICRVRKRNAHAWRARE